MSEDLEFDEDIDPELDDEIEQFIARSQAVNNNNNNNEEEEQEEGNANNEEEQRFMRSILFNVAEIVDADKDVAVDKVPSSR